jgi:hypothetical protein
MRQTKHTDPTLTDDIHNIHGTANYVGTVANATFGAHSGERDEGAVQPIL